MLEGREREVAADLIVDAWSWSHYWAKGEITKQPEEERCFVEEIAFKGGEVTIYDVETEEKLGVLNEETLEKGWEVFRHKYPRHYADAWAEEADAITGDVYLQCCVMGEVIYG